MSSSSRRVRVHRDSKDVMRLIGLDLERSPFQSAAWLAAWRDIFVGDVEGEISAVTIEDRDTGEIVLVLPLVFDRRWGLRRLVAWDRAVSDYNGPLTAKGFTPSPEEMRGLWREIRRALPPADTIEIEKMPERVGACANPMMLAGPLRRSKFSQNPMYLDGNYEEIAVARFDPSHRRTLAKKRRKLENKGRLEFALLEGEEGLDALSLVLGWREQRFGDTGTPEAFAALQRFYRLLCAQGGCGRVGRMTLDGVVISGCFGTLIGTSFQLLAVAHDPRWNNWSPGLLAIENAIETLCGQGPITFDFTIGDEPYKREYDVVSQALWDLRSPLSLLGRAYLVARRLREVARVIRGRWREMRRRRAASKAA